MNLRIKKDKYFHASDLKLDDEANDYYVLNCRISPEPEDRRLIFDSLQDATAFIDRCVDYMGDEYFLKRFVFEKTSDSGLLHAMTGPALRKKTAEIITQCDIIAIPKRIRTDGLSMT